MDRFEEISRALAEAGLDGWLFYDFRLSDPLAYRILGLPETGLATRRWFYFVPAAALPRALVSAVEAHRLDALPVGMRIVYRSEREMISGLARLVEGCRRIAMNYSPMCAIPYVSRVDAGTLELVRATGVEVVSAADLIQRFEAVLTAAQLAGHRRAALHLRAIVDEAFGEVARCVRENRSCTEYGLQRFVLERIGARGLRTDEAPIVAVNAHAANPHFCPGATHDTAIKPGDLVLLDLFAKETAPDSIYGDLTWMGYVGDAVPEHLGAAFKIVAEARDAAVDLVRSRVAAGAPVTGEEADRAARHVIEAAGYGEQFVHRTGHSIGREVHGTGANLDSLETRDHRSLIENTCFSVEPGIYLPERFGIRSELDMTIEAGRAEISGGPPQVEIIAMTARFAERQ
ncbi:MAG TPA: M24 family metallopeptidase [Candidatus Binataceae bacterium]|nr:M24 family metallopeptidase [Candidatus Binataceae bacterium]